MISRFVFSVHSHSVQNEIDTPNPSNTVGTVRVESVEHSVEPVENSEVENSNPVNDDSVRTSNKAKALKEFNRESSSDQLGVFGLSNSHRVQNGIVSHFGRRNSGSDGYIFTPQ